MSSNPGQPDPTPVNGRGNNLFEGPELLEQSGLEVENQLTLGNSRQDVFPVVSEAEQKNSAMIGATTKPQPALRLVVNRDERFEVPRKYDQSTSGRMSSTGTAPELSRSSAMAVDSAIRSFVDSAFRRYPTEVPQRLAYESCAPRSSELRYVRSDSIDGVLPTSNVRAIPSLHLQARGALYDERMDVRDIRRRRLRNLVEGFGSQQALADSIDSEQNYISQLLSGKKPFGEKTARRIEKQLGKPSGWLDLDVEQVTMPEPTHQSWPFAIDRALWDRLSPQQKREIESSFSRQVLGANIEQAAVNTAKKRPA